MKIINEGIQYPIFTKIKLFNDEFEKADFINNFKRETQQYILVKPFVIPLPLEIHEPDTPRVILSDTNTNSKVEIGTNKVMIYFREHNTETESQVERIYKFLTSYQINRIGIINNFTIKGLNKNGSDYLRDQLIKEDNLPSPKELDINYNTESISTIPDIHLNNLISIRTNLDSNDIKIQTDINTLKELQDTPSFNIKIEDFRKVKEYVEKKNKSLQDNFIHKGKVTF